MSPRAFLIDLLVPAWPPLAARERNEVARAAGAFLALALSRAPAPVRIVARTGGATLSVFLMLASGGRPARAAALLDRLARLPGPLAAVIRVHRTLVVLAAYEHPHMLAALGVEEPALRQERFRARRQALLAEPGA